MRSMLALAGCSMQPPAPPVVSWHYGVGNGDGVQSTQPVTTNYGYGAEGMTGVVMSAPPAPASNQQLAAPVPAPNSNPPGDHI